MENFLYFLLIISPIILIVGLVKPSAIIRWGDPEKKTRKRVGTTFLIFFFVVLTILIITDDTEEQNQATSQPTQIQTRSEEEKTADVAENRKKILTAYYVKQMSLIAKNLVSSSHEISAILMKFPNWTVQDTVDIKTKTMSIEGLYDQANKLTPPDELEEAHELYLQALKKFQKAMPMVRHGISIMDQDEISTATQMMVDGSNIMNQANDIVNQFQIQ